MHADRSPAPRRTADSASLQLVHHAEPCADACQGATGGATVLRCAVGAVEPADLPCRPNSTSPSWLGQCYETAVGRARSLGLSTEGMNRLRSLLAERARNSWQIGDLLVHVYGAPPSAGVMDGSRLVLGRLADELGCSVSWLVAVRIAAAAWPTRDRRASAPWTVHRALSARDDRVTVLARFIEDCDRAGVAPSSTRLSSWLGSAEDAAEPKLRGVGPPEARSRGPSGSTGARPRPRRAAAGSSPG